MVCNIQEVPSCPLAHCTQFPALLSAPSFAWQGLTVWLLICLALDSTLILSWLSTCDHKGGMPDDAPYCCSSEQHTAHIVPHTIPSLPLTPMPASRSPRGLGTPQPRGSGTFGHPQGSGTLSPEPRGLICANPDPLPRLGRSPSLGPKQQAMARSRAGPEARGFAVRT